VASSQLSEPGREAGDMDQADGYFTNDFVTFSARPCGQVSTGKQSQRHDAGRDSRDPACGSHDAGRYRPGVGIARRPDSGRSRPLGAYAGLAVAGRLIGAGFPRTVGEPSREAALYVRNITATATQSVPSSNGWEVKNWDRTWNTPPSLPECHSSDELRKR
jgi:hypothetical protein